MEAVLTGDMYCEKISIKYEDNIIYNGYVDNLVTSEDEELELKLNYGDKYNKSNVIARRLGDSIFWIPNIKYCCRPQYRYVPILFSLDEFKELWETIRYNAESDLKQIKEVTNVELLLTWFITSNVRYNVDNIYDYVNTLRSKFICTDIESEEVNKLIFQLFNWNKELNQSNLGVICEQSENMMQVKIYLDDNGEWDAIRIVDEMKIYLRITDKIYVSVN